MNECLEFAQQNVEVHICLPRSERKAPNKRGLEQSSVRGHMEDPGFISQHHTSLEDDGHFQGRLTGIFRGTKSGISTRQESVGNTLCGQSRGPDSEERTGGHWFFKVSV